MPCIKTDNAILCFSNQYRYKGYYFEWHNFCGPVPLKKNGDPSLRIPKGFWDIITEFQELTILQKEEFRVL